MLERLFVIGRALALALRGHRELVLENLALRQQLTALKRTTQRSHLQTRDRLFWIALAGIWRNWRTALVLVQPNTVVRWHREWLRRRWTAFGVFEFVDVFDEHHELNWCAGHANVQKFDCSSDLSRLPQKLPQSVFSFPAAHPDR
jgi:hypothetical protein